MQINASTWSSAARSSRSPPAAPASRSRPAAAATTARAGDRPRRPTRPRSAALDITGGGTANSVERDTENGATWEVEVTKPDGNTVDVRLDEQYQLVVVEGDSEASDGSE